MRLTGPKAKICRRFGVNIFGSPKYDRILKKNPKPPGVHGGKRLKKLSSFGEQLKAKQLAQMMYALSEKQFRNYVQKATHKTGDSGVNLLTLLESRADNIVYKSGLANTIFQARQMVNHGHFELNGKKIMTPSIHIKPESTLTIRDNKKKSALYEEISKAKQDKSSIPSWLQVDRKKLEIKISSLPQTEHFDPIIDTKPIIEFYSR